jgi:2-dehydropantoate 2-reductase
MDRIAVVGAGAVGGYFGAVLARAGSWVAVIARGKHLEAIQRAGLRIEGPNESFSVQPALATSEVPAIGTVDAVIVAVKAWQVPEIAAALTPLLGPNTRVLPLQNGVEATYQLQAAIGREYPLAGLCRIISMVEAPGRIRHVGGQPTIALGEPDGAPLSGNGRGLADALRAGGIAVETPTDITAALWEKLLVIGAFAGTGAVTRSSVGEIRQPALARGLLCQLMEEVAAVARARGVRLADDVVVRALAFIDSLPPTGTASMQRDIAEGRPSELEAIIGSVVRFGDEAGIATPAMDFVYASLLPQELRARAGRRE